MVKGISRLKPGVSRRTHLFFSALLWTGIGCLLLTKGISRLDQPGKEEWFVVVAAFALGAIKSRIALDKAARKGTARILTMEDGTCAGAVYSLKTWALVLFMMGMGVILRHTSLPDAVVALICLTVGCSLLLSSRLAWVAWFNNK